MTRSHAPTSARAGFTMIEAAMASVLVAVMLSAAVAVSGAAGMAQYKVAERATAGALADAMLAEISALAYAEPGGGALGPDSGEDATRAAYDDVDDYHGLSESAPAERGGAAIPGLTGWQRLVSVNYAVAATPDISSVSDTGLKRIVITIKHNNATVLTRQTLRSNAR